MSEVEDFVADNGKIAMPRILNAKKESAGKQSKEKEGSQSLFTSFISSLLSTSSPSERDVYEQRETSEELEAEAICKGVVKDCKLWDCLVADSRFMDTEALEHLLRMCSARVLESDAPVKATPEGTLAARSNASVFFLEVLVWIGLQNKDRFDKIAPLVCEPLLLILKRPGEFHELLVRRATVGLARLCLRLLHREESAIRDTLLSHCLNAYVQLSDMVTSSGDSRSTSLVASTNVSSVVHYVSDEILAATYHLVAADTHRLIRAHWPAIQKLVGWSAAMINSNSAASLAGELAPKFAWETLSLILTTPQSPSADSVSSDGLHADNSRMDSAGSSPSTEQRDDIVNIDNFNDMVDLLVGFIVAGATAITSNHQDSTISASTVAKNLLAQTESHRGRVPEGIEGRDCSNSNQVRTAVVTRAVLSLELLYKLHTRIPGLMRDYKMQQKAESEETPEALWDLFWLPLLSALAQQCYHPSREIRQHALNYLQRALLLPQLTDSVLPTENRSIFQKRVHLSIFYAVMFPLLDTLVEPAVENIEQHLHRLSIQNDKLPRHPQGSPKQTPYALPAPSNPQHPVPIEESSLSGRAVVPSAQLHSTNALSITRAGGVPNRSTTAFSSSLTFGTSIEEIRIRSSALLCKLFLQYLHRLVETLSSAELEELWAKLLTVLKQYYALGIRVRPTNQMNPMDHMGKDTRRSPSSVQDSSLVRWRNDRCVSAHQQEELTLLGVILFLNV
jgi:brefeldin A-resistance guanine nucleotide exchange factor 1